MVYDDLKQAFPKLSLGTVYRNLSMFKASGEIVSLGTVNGVERFDAIVEPHVHFICSGCGAVAADMAAFSVLPISNSRCLLRSCSRSLFFAIAQSHVTTVHEPLNLVALFTA